MAITLVSFTPTSNKAELKKFVGLPWEMKAYRDDPHWVPPLRMQVLDNLDTKKNPFYKHAEINLWNAYQDGKVVGRIAAIIDDAHNKFHEEKTGFWGFFECVDDIKVAKELFEAAEQWTRAKGMKVFRGPANPSLNHECGVLVDGFDRDPYVMMTHNPKYYDTLIAKLGHAKTKDLLAFEMYTQQVFPERVQRIAKKVAQKSNITFRPINMKKFKDELQIIQDIYNDAWEKNWGFVPMNDEEFKHMAKGMKDILWPQFCVLAFSGDEPIGFSLSLPDINQLLKTIPDGKLLPFGIFKLLLGMNPKKKKITQVRVITLGIKQKYRASGVGALFYLEAYRTAKEMGLERGEMSWILEDNEQMLSSMNTFADNPPAYKRYRIYDKTL